MSEPVLFPFIGSAIEAIAIGALILAALIHLPAFVLVLRGAAMRLRAARSRTPLR